MHNSDVTRNGEPQVSGVKHSSFSASPRFPPPSLLLIPLSLLLSLFPPPPPPYLPDLPLFSHPPLVTTAELGTQQVFSFATTTMRQRNITSRTSQGPEKNQKIVWPQCLDGVATINIVRWQ